MLLHLSRTLRLSVRNQCDSAVKLKGMCQGTRSLSRQCIIRTNSSRLLRSQHHQRRPLSSSSTKLAHEVPMSDSRPEGSTAPQMQVPTASNMPASAPPDNPEFWRKIPMWKDVPADKFMSWQWSQRNDIQFQKRTNRAWFRELIGGLVPDQLLFNRGTGEMQSREDFLDDIFAGFECSTMSVRMSPYMFSRINWDDPRHDPIFRQFMPLGSVLLPDHPMCKLDSLHEGTDSPVPGLVHRYPDKVLFLATSICPTYCAYCTRSYGVGADTVELEKKGQFKQGKSRWDKCLSYIAKTPEVQDVVISGGDSFFIGANHILEIGRHLINLPNIKKFRFASKGLAVSPGRFLDPNDDWASALIQVSQEAERAGKRMALHTHFNHPNEISWITEKASKRLRDAGVTVRNQSVLLKGVNDDVQTMGTLIRKLSDTLRVQPYYVYQCDMVPKAEHFRTPLRTLINMEEELTGSIAGHDLPKFIVDLPGGGGKRNAQSGTFDPVNGVSYFKAPAVKGGKDVYAYYDPVDSLTKTD